uniref:Uncharacterized protein n=1 Tax=Glossina morsitans morsitans TaxID=37546 RepID=A0A1B0FJH0_GLOMM
MELLTLGTSLSISLGIERDTSKSPECKQESESSSLHPFSSNTYSLSASDHQPPVGVRSLLEVFSLQSGATYIFYVRSLNNCRLILSKFSLRNGEQHANLMYAAPMWGLDTMPNRLFHYFLKID